MTFVKQTLRSLCAPPSLHQVSTGSPLGLHWVSTGSPLGLHQAPPSLNRVSTGPSLLHHATAYKWDIGRYGWDGALHEPQQISEDKMWCFFTRFSCIIVGIGLINLLIWELKMEPYQFGHACMRTALYYIACASKCSTMCYIFKSNLHQIRSDCQFHFHELDQWKVSGGNCIDKICRHSLLFLCTRQTACGYIVYCQR